MGVAGPGHADGAALERHVGELGLQVRVRGAAGAVAVFAVTGLRHEAVDDAVKRHAVIELFARQKLHALGMTGRDVVAQSDDDLAARRLDDERVVRVGARGERAGIAG